jgi:hypothetical protein
MRDKEKEQKKEMAQRGQLLLILNSLHIYRVLLGHLQTKSAREREEGAQVGNSSDRGR